MSLDPLCTGTLLSNPRDLSIAWKLSTLIISPSNSDCMDTRGGGEGRKGEGWTFSTLDGEDRRKIREGKRGDEGKVGKVSKDRFRAWRFWKIWKISKETINL